MALRVAQLNKVRAKLSVYFDVPHEYAICVQVFGGNVVFQDHTGSGLGVAASFLGSIRLVPNALLPDKLSIVSRLHWKRWGDEWVVFNSSSGQTHKLDRLSAILLLNCEDSEIAVPELLALVAEQAGTANDANLAVVVTRIVEQCESLGLLARTEG